MTSKYKETIKSTNTKKKEGRFVAVSVMEPLDQRMFYRLSSKTKFRKFWKRYTKKKPREIKILSKPVLVTLVTKSQKQAQSSLTVSTIPGTTPVRTTKKYCVFPFVFK